MKRRKRLLIGLVVILVFASGALVSAQGSREKIEKGLLWEALSDQSLGNSTEFEFRVVFEPEYWPDFPSFEGVSWDERGNLVWKILEDAQKVRQKVLSKKGYQGTCLPINNHCTLGATLTGMEEIASMGGVAGIRSIPEPIKLDPVEVGPPLQPDQVVKAESNEQSPLATLSGWGITHTGADQVWGKGYRGEGITIGFVDSGVDAGHEIFAGRVLTTVWHDAVGRFTEPGDPNGHGTHTASIAIGGQTPTGVYIGVAPEAEVIACRAFNSSGYGTYPQIEECLNWMLAPEGDPSRRPMIVNNSWNVGSEDYSFLTEFEALVAAGITPVVSAGNTGTSGCGSLASAGDYTNVFSIGAHGADSWRPNWSACGPRPDGTTIGPDVVAPGENITAAYPGGLYRTMSGTSMAAPHVAGILALAMQVRPSLIGDFDEQRRLLHATAIDLFDLTLSCGGISGLTSPNHTVGYGKANAFNYVDALLYHIYIPLTKKSYP